MTETPQLVLTPRHLRFLGELALGPMNGPSMEWQGIENLTDPIYIREIKELRAAGLVSVDKLPEIFDGAYENALEPGKYTHTNEQPYMISHQYALTEQGVIHILKMAVEAQQKMADAAEPAVQ